MTHKRNAASLWSAAEEGDLDVVGTELLREIRHRVPRWLGTGILVVLNRVDVGAEPGVRLDNAPPSDLQQRNQRWAKVPVI
jgi:hypothetical protein